ncbi:hypothetical protein ACH5RR_014866 [Cinchona calisaya]|uniref:Uncharacterized protein n=1 Tax=Cinchona calisaya TaxID=153742 RepID=A0ABD2ZV30_9GENT
MGGRGRNSNLKILVRLKGKAMLQCQMKEYPTEDFMKRESTIIIIRTKELLGSFCWVLHVCISKKLPDNYHYHHFELILDIGYGDGYKFFFDFYHGLGRRS